MVKFAILSSEDLWSGESNPTGCMSAKRYCSGCIGCDYLKNIVKKSDSFEDVLSRVSCKPLLTPESEEAIKNLYAAQKEHRKSVRKLQSANKIWKV